MSYTLICEGEHKCSSYEKCSKKPKNTCIKPKQFKTYACNGDDCKNCNNLKNCELILNNSKSLNNVRNKINDLLKRLKEIEEDIQYLQENPEAKIAAPYQNNDLLKQLEEINPEEIIIDGRKCLKKTHLIIDDLETVTPQMLQNEKDELIEEIRTLRKEEHKKLHILRKRRLQKI